MMVTRLFSKLDHDEIISAVKWGGKFGTVLLSVSSAMLILSMFGFGNQDLWKRWVRISIEIFLMAGWSFGSIAMIRQIIARTFGHLIAVIGSGLCGVLIDNAFGIFFSLIAVDAPNIILVNLIGLAVSFLFAGMLTHNSMQK